MTAIGRKGGQIGGKRRLKTMTIDEAGLASGRIDTTSSTVRYATRLLCLRNGDRGKEQ
jgi:hypothetical protein